MIQIQVSSIQKLKELLILAQPGKMLSPNLGMGRNIIALQHCALVLQLMVQLRASTNRFGQSPFLSYGFTNSFSQNVIHSIEHEKTIVGNDDGCHYHACITEPARAQASIGPEIISKQEVIIDNCHLRGHTDARCRAKFDPKKNKEAKHFNTQVAEQTFSWFGKFKHIGRHMGLESYWVFIIGLFHERNKVCIARQKARNKRKRKRSNDFE